MCIDDEDMIWLAHWGGFKVSRFNPETGEILETVKVPSAHTTSCAFGGENLDELYITTARERRPEEEYADYPNSGGLFKIKTKTTGQAAVSFKG